MRSEFDQRPHSESLTHPVSLVRGQSIDEGRLYVYERRLRPTGVVLRELPPGAFAVLDPSLISAVVFVEGSTDTVREYECDINCWTIVSRATDPSGEQSLRLRNLMQLRTAHNLDPMLQPDPVGMNTEVVTLDSTLVDDLQERAVAELWKAPPTPIDPLYPGRHVFTRPYIDFSAHLHGPPSPSPRSELRKQIVDLHVRHKLPPHLLGMREVTD